MAREDLGLMALGFVSCFHVLLLISSHPERCLENKHQTTRDILVGKSLVFLAGSFFLFLSELL